MRQKTFAILLILVSTASAFGQSQAEWIKFTSPEKHFSLMLPGEPTLEVVPLPLKHNRFFRYEQGYGFVIEYFDNLDIPDPGKYLDTTRDGIVTALKGTLTRETKIRLDGHEGRELEFFHKVSNGSEVLSRVRIYFAGRTLYSMSYIWRKDMDSRLASQISEKYFSSIKIANK